MSVCSVPSALVVSLTLIYESVLHRADYVKILLEEAIAAGAQIILGANVVDIDFDVPHVVVHDNETIKADVIVGADGKVTLLSYLNETVKFLQDCGQQPEKNSWVNRHHRWKPVT